MTAILNLVGTAQFIKKLSKDRMTDKQVNRAVAYLRAKGCSFYDDWGREHCSTLLYLQQPFAKQIVLKAMAIALNYGI